MPSSAGEDRKILQFAIPPGHSRQRIDVYLTRHVANATRNKVQRGIDDGLVLVNGKRVKPSYLVNPNDSIVVTLPRPPRTEALPENIPLDIVYEDDELLVVNKPAGMVTHPAYRNYAGTLVNALLFHSQKLSGVNSALRPGIVHRLDKDTSGLLVVAKNDQAHHRLAGQFSKHSIEREYRAIVWGKFNNKRGEIKASLGRSKKDRRKVSVTVGGKHAATHYEVLKQFEFLALVKLNLKTGRTHQIRVHLAHIGHPVFGDATYGGRNNLTGGLSGKKAQRAANLLKFISRQALHAKTLGFVHPGSGAMVRFDSDLPEDMRSLLEKLGDENDAA